MQNPEARASGFTLVEVLVALAIVAFGLSALFTTVNQTVRTSTYLRDKTFAQWIALNRISEARLEAQGQTPGEPKMTGELEYAGQTWRWELETIQTPVEGIVRLEARVAPQSGPKGTWPGQATGFIGDAIAIGSEPFTFAGPKPGPLPTQQ